KNPNFCDERNLLSISKALQDVDIIHSSFEKCLKYAKEGDFLYLDPPYYPISKTSSFTNYTKEDFGIEHQINLFKVFNDLNNLSCKIMLSNSYSEFVINLYKDYRKVTLNAKRAINCDAKKRGIIKEILILNDFQ
ncbi:MAG: DNA adenine methylase, partial [Candidatus Odinarchaeota archaeon]